MPTARMETPSSQKLHTDMVDSSFSLLLSMSLKPFSLMPRQNKARALAATDSAQQQTLSIPAFIVMTFSKMTLSMMTLSKMTLGMMPLNKMTPA